MLDEVRSETPLEGMSRADFLKVAGATGLLVTASGTVLSVVGGTAEAQVVVVGSFGPLFVEPYIYFPTYFNKRNNKKGKKEVRVKTTAECIPPPDDADEDRMFCKPAAGTNGVLPNGLFLYMNALEGEEDTKRFGTDADKSIEDSQSRVIRINYEDNTKSHFVKPHRASGGVEEPATELIEGVTVSKNRPGNNGDFFCGSQCHLPGGSILAVGGTNWYQEGTGVDGADPLELQGLSASRFFDYKKLTWFLTRNMNFGRWYPSVVPLPNGDPLVMGGVHKLEKPIYLPPQEPGEPPGFDSGANVRQVERFDLQTGKWKIQGDSDQPTGSARRSLPLQARIQLLPNGHVVYNGVGQAFSPNGQDPLQATWNNAASYNPETESWTEEGLAGAECVKPFNIGAKLSCFQVPKLMEPNGNGDYDTMELVTGGGTHGLAILTNPGSYFANNQCRVTTFTVDGDDISQVSRDVGDMFNSVNSATAQNPPPPEAGGAPLGRWFGDAALLPTGEIFVSGGADRDEVFFPGAEFPVIECEIFDPEEETWSVVGALPVPRTYHNTNSMLPTGEVMIGGHAPIVFGYISHDADVIPGTRNADGRDPTFQIYSPEYVGDPNRPVIDVARNGEKDPLSAKTGGNLVIPTSTSGIDDVVIMRLPSTTHINDTEQRGLVLPDITQNATSVTATMPKTLAEYGGPGFCLAFIRKNGLPSEGVFVQVKK